MSKKHKDTPQTLTISETAQALGTDNKTVRKLVEEGELGYSGQRINKSSVVDLVRKNIIVR